MIFGGGVGIVNIIILVSMLLLIILLIGIYQFFHSPSFTSSVYKSKIKYSAICLLLGIFALPAIVAIPIIIYDYFEQQELYRNDFYHRLIDAIVEDNPDAVLTAVKNCDESCFLYIAEGDTKFDNLIRIAGESKAYKAMDLLRHLNEKEKPKK